MYIYIINKSLVKDHRKKTYDNISRFKGAKRLPNKI